MFFKNKYETKIISDFFELHVEIDEKYQELISFLDKLTISAETKPDNKIFLYVKVIISREYFKEALNIYKDFALEPIETLFLRMPTSGGVVIKDYGEKREYCIVNWKDKGLFVSRKKSNEFYFLAQEDNFELRTMLKYFIIAPFAYMGEISIIHASTVKLRDKVFLLMADSTKGKTTLTLLLWALGARIISEDISYIIENNRVLNLPARNYLTIRLGLLKGFKNYLPNLYEKYQQKIQGKSEQELFDLGKSGEVKIDIKNFIDNHGDDKAFIIDGIIEPEINCKKDGYSITATNNLKDLVAEANRNFMVKWFEGILDTKGMERKKEDIALGGLEVFKLHFGVGYFNFGNDMFSEIERLGK